MPRRVLFVVNHARWFLTHRIPLAEAAARAGYEVHVASPASPYVQKIAARGFTCHEIPLHRSGRNPFDEARMLFRLVKLYRRLRPVLVHHISMKPVLYGTLAARIVGVPAVVNAMTGLGHLFVSGRLADRILRRAVGLAFRMLVRHRRMRVLFQNSDDLTVLTTLRFVRAGDAVLVGSGVDTAAFHPAEARRSGPVIVTMPARMLRSKGVLTFAAAARALRKPGLDARFVLVGGPDELNPDSLTAHELEQLAASGGVEYAGERDDMPAVYREADIVCLPTSYREGIPKVLLEAAASGLPIVTTDNVGCRDVVADGVNGFLVPAHNEQALAGALERLIRDPDLRRRMGQRGRERAIAEFSIERLTALTLDIYSHLADTRGDAHWRTYEPRTDH